MNTPQITANNSISSNGLLSTGLIKAQEVNKEHRILGRVGDATKEGAKASWNKAKQVNEDHRVLGRMGDATKEGAKATWNKAKQVNKEHRVLGRMGDATKAGAKASWNKAKQVNKEHRVLQKMTGYTIKGGCMAAKTPVGKVALRLGAAALFLEVDGACDAVEGTIGAAEDYVVENLFGEEKMVGLEEMENVIDTLEDLNSNLTAVNIALGEEKASKAISDRTKRFKKATKW